MKNFLSLGLTEEHVRKAFARHPYFMSASDDKRCLAGLRIMCPTPQKCSEKLPRRTVLNLLASRGVIKRGIKLNHLTKTELKFTGTYITSYQ
ncbi:hypothetical protein EJB05_49559, partial [Eragrostis curvula]